MVGTLIKHEARRTLKWYGLILAGGLLVVGLASLAAVVLPGSLRGFFTVLAIMGAVAVSAIVPIWLGIDFYRTSYGRTGYLTRALPVRGSTIFWVKALYAYALSVLAVAVTVLLGYVAWVATAIADGGTVAQVNDALSTTVRTMAETLPTWLLVLAVLAVVLWPLTWLASYWFAATVGSEAWINRLGLGGPVLMWFAFYAASQVAGMLGIFVPLTVAYEQGAYLLRTQMIDLSTMADQDVVPIGVFLAMFLVAAIGIGWASVSFDRKAELR